MQDVKVKNEWTEYAIPVPPMKEKYPSTYEQAIAVSHLDEMVGLLASTGRALDHDRRTNNKGLAEKIKTLLDELNEVKKSQVGCGSNVIPIKTEEGEASNI